MFGETSFGSYGKKRYRFCGKEKDEESGLYYYGMRYYSAWTCRFMSVDPLAGKYVKQTPYCYADCNPIMKNDPTGMGTEEGKGNISTLEHKGEGNASLSTLEKNGSEDIKLSNLSSENPGKAERRAKKAQGRLEKNKPTRWDPFTGRKVEKEKRSLKANQYHAFRLRNLLEDGGGKIEDPFKMPEEREVSHSQVKQHTENYIELSAKAEKPIHKIYPKEISYRMNLYGDFPYVNDQTNLVDKVRGKKEIDKIVKLLNKDPSLIVEITTSINYGVQLSDQQLDSTTPDPGTTRTWTSTRTEFKYLGETKGTEVTMSARRTLIYMGVIIAYELVDKGIASGRIRLKINTNTKDPSVSGATIKFVHK